MIDVSIKSIKAVTAQHQDVTGSFRIKSTDRRRFWCKLFPDHPRILTDLAEQSGGRMADICYRIDVSALHAGDEVRGRITVVSEDGEMTIPVEVVIADDALEAGEEEINSLEDFSGHLVVDHPQKALKMYRSEAFARLIDRQAPQLTALYRGLSTNPLTVQKMEEFFVLAGLKRKVDLSALCQKTEFYALKESVQEKILIKKNEWGVFSVSVSTDADFIELPKTYLTQDDFIGSYCSVNFIIRQDRLGRRVRMGKIRIEGCGQILEVDITASAKKKDSRSLQVARRRMWQKLSEQYLTFLREGRQKDYLKNVMLPYLESLTALGPDTAAVTVLKAWLYHLCESYKDRNRLLQSMKDTDFERDLPEIKNLYAYLLSQSGIMPSRQVDPASQIRSDYQKHSENVMLLQLYFLTDAHILRLSSYQMQLMERTFVSGCRSPFLYEMALQLIQKDNSVLENLREFNQQVLLYAIKTDRMTEDLMLRCTYMADNAKGFSEVLYRILSEGYARYPENQGILDAICRLFMKGPSHDPRSFDWYALAIEAGRSMTRLYEFYMETISENWQKLLPLAVRRYFLYSDGLSDRNRAFLYANIIRNREEDPETYQDYQEKMRQFAHQAFLKGKIDSNLTTLYHDLLEELSAEDADRMTEMIFTSQVFCDDENVRFVVVVHKELDFEEIQPLTHGTALIHLYTKEAQIFFEDAQQRRYRANAAYSVQPLMDEDDYLEKCMDKHCRTTGYILNRLSLHPEISKENKYLYLAAEAREDFTDSFRNAIRRKLLTYYQAHEDDFLIEEELLQLHDDLYADADLGMLIDVLLAHGFYQRVFALICKFGSEAIGNSQLVRLLSRLIEEEGAAKDDELLLLAEIAFRRGIYDERILSYLIAYFEGTMEDMRAIRKEAAAFYVETMPMDERIVERVVACGMYISDGSRILKSYIDHGGRHRYIRPFVEVMLKSLFDHGEVIDDYLAFVIRDVIREEEQDRLLKLMLLMYDANKKELSTKEEVEAEELLEEFIQEDVRLGFFQKLPKSFQKQYQLEDVLFIETMAEEDDRVILHYRIENVHAPSTSAFKQEPMKRIFRGLFQKVFTLFYTERLVYYIEIIRDEVSIRSKERTVTAAGAQLSGQSRYQRINRMLKLRQDKKNAALLEELRDYRKTEAMMRAIFKMEGEQ